MARSSRSPRSRRRSCPCCAERGRILIGADHAKRSAAARRVRVMRPMAGEIVHLELPSRSFERSAAFYGKIFGWRTEGAQSGGHLRFETPPAAASGSQGIKGSWILHALAQAPGPLPFVAVDDIGATLAEVERQGGRILA